MNGVDQGLATRDIPPSVYGVIDLYGQAAQATIIDAAGNVHQQCMMFAAGDVCFKAYALQFPAHQISWVNE